MSKQFEFDLYLDESGTFTETSTNPNERAENRKQGQRFPSQLVGVLIPRGQLTETTARKVLEASFNAAGLILGSEVHGADLPRGDSYDALIKGLVAQVSAKQWQPIRLINQEGVSYGDRISTYTNMVAELVLRICEQKSREGIPEISLRLFYASVKLGENADGSPIFLEQKEYSKRLQEYLAFLAVRRGLAIQSSHWKIEHLEWGSGRTWPELQICDLISNASHNNYRKCGEEASAALRDAFGAYDYSMVVRLVLEQADQLVQDGSLGLALRGLAERLIQDDGGGEVRREARQRLDQILEKLSRFTAPPRNAQLALLTGWLEQLINQQRSLDLGYRLTLWLQKEVNAPLRARLGESVSHTLTWFSYALHFWALTACNHKGDLVNARKEAKALEQLVPDLAGQWEHVSLLMEGLVAQAVHQTDCLEYDEASKRMELVANYYRDLSSLFADAFPEVFPECVRSDLRGKALGTWLQNEIYAGSYDLARLTKAREISEQAIEEFSFLCDNERQYQYRCQLDTVAGNFQVAREYLARSLHLDDTSHSTIAREINTLDGVSQGFALLHWLRLGTACYLSGDKLEWEDFASALKQSKLLNSPWCKGEASDDYPTHGILRRVALITAIQGERNNAALGRLRNLDPIKKGSMVLGIIQLATYAEVAALTWQTEPSQAQRLLDCDDRDRLGLKQLLKAMSEQSRDLFPSVWQITQSWSNVLKRVIEPENANENVREFLLGLGRTVNY